MKEIVKQETLEEVAEKRIPTSTSIWDLTETRRSDFKAGAKWQAKRMYSEEDMEEAFTNGLNRSFDSDFDRWFEQFKKK